MKYAIEYESRLAFAGPVREHHCELRLAPLENEQQTTLGLKVETTPESEVRSYLDCFGNRVHYFDVTASHSQLLARLQAVVQTLLENPFGFTPVPPAQERKWIEQRLEHEPRLLDFLLHRSACAPARERAAAFFAGAPELDGKSPLIETVIAARDWIADRLEHEPQAAEARPPLEQVLAAGAGDCQDLTHALLVLVRSWGVPARYVAGCQNVSDDEEARNVPHAWAEVMIPGAGWRGFDVVNRLVVNDQYVAVAVGRDAEDTAPHKSVYKGEEAPPLPRVKLQFNQQEQ